MYIYVQSLSAHAELIDYHIGLSSLFCVVLVVHWSYSLVHRTVGESSAESVEVLVVCKQRHIS